MGGGWRLVAVATPEGRFLIKGQDGVGNLNLGEPIRQPAR